MKSDSESRFLTMEEVLGKLEYALRKKKPFSFVRIGDGENMILSQDTVFSVRHVLKHKWSKPDKQLYRGIQLPDLKLRDRLIRSIQKADLVGILTYDNTLIRTPADTKRKLTDKIFAYYRFQPKLTCDACITRVFPQKEAFWNLLRERRILVISNWAVDLKRLLEMQPYRLRVTGAIPFAHSRQLDDTLQLVYGQKDEFDAVLLSCGASAVIMAQKIAKKTGKVAIDFGKSAEYMVTGRAGLGFAHSSDSPHDL